MSDRPCSWAVQSSHTLPGAGRAGRLRRHRRPAAASRGLRRGGGHLIVGIRTGYGDEEARARFAIAPDVLNKPAGVWYEEFSNLAAPLELDAARLTLTPAAHATRWADGLLADGADVLARYRHREFGRFAAITARQHGDGRITVLGTVPNPALGAELMRWAVPEPIAAGWSIVGSPVRVSSGRVADGGRVWFVHNWSGSDATVTVPALTDLDSGAALDAGTTISLAPWSCLTAIER